MARKHFVQQIVSIEIEVERPTAILRSLAMTVHVGTVNVGCKVSMKDKTNTFLDEEKDASAPAAAIRMFCALALSAGI